MTERWIVRYRRYHSDEVSEQAFSSEGEARDFARNYLYDRGPDARAVVKKYVEASDD